MAAFLITLFLARWSESAAFFVLACFPWIAIGVVALSYGQIRLDFPSSRRELSLIHAGLILPGVVLLASTPGETLAWAPLVCSGAVVCAMLTFAAAKAEPKSPDKRPFLLVFALVGLIYGVGIVGTVNAWLDAAGGEVYHVRVIRKAGSSRFGVKLEPWGPRAEPNDVTVSRDIYDTLQPGSLICVTVHPGALRLPWFVATSCEKEVQYFKRR